MNIDVPSLSKFWVIILTNLITIKIQYLNMTYNIFLQKGGDSAINHTPMLCHEEGQNEQY